MKWLNKEDIQAAGDFLSLSEFVTPSIFMLEDGSMGSVIQLEGESLQTKSQDTIRCLQSVWHQAVMGLSDDQACFLTEYRHRVPLTVEQRSDNKFISTLVDAQANRRYFQQDLFLTLLCKPIFSSLAKNTGRSVSADRLVMRLEQLRNLFLSLLKSFGPRLVVQTSNDSGRPLLAEVLGLVVNGAYMPQNKKPVNCYERTPLNQYRLGDDLAHRQLLVGRHITYLGGAKQKNRLAAVISVNRYPSTSELTTHSVLNQLDFEWIQTQSFEPLSKTAAMQRIQRQQSKLKTASDQAVTQRQALTKLEDQLASEQLTVGYHQRVILVFADNEADLEKNTIDLQACLMEQGFGCVKEALGLESAFAALQVGGVAHGVRKALITSINFSHFCPLLGYSSGHRGCNHLRRPICLLQTPEGMPYYFNFHVPGSTSNPSLGHTLVLGASNSGKTVLLTYLDAMRSALGGRRFFFDRDKGAYLYFKAIEGAYIHFDPTDSDIQLNPFSLPDNATNRRFLTQWLEQMALADSSETMQPKERSILRQCVDYAYEALSTDSRCLSNVLRILPKNFPYLQNFFPWLKSAEGRDSGEFNSYFDNVSDTLAFSRATAFDMTYLLDHAPALLKKLVLMYLFHRIEISCQGDLVTITLDEGWQYFSDQYWRNKMRDWLPTLRKLNAHLVIATQSASSILQSGIQDMVLDNCSTQLYFGNPKASADIYVDALRLSQEEWECVQNFPVSERWMLLKHAKDSMVVRLDVGKPEFFPILSSNAESVRLYQSMQSENKQPPVEWLDLLLKQLGAGHA